jgi:hypothetical protein
MHCFWLLEIETGRFEAQTRHYFPLFEIQMACLRLKPCIVFGCLRLKQRHLSPGILCHCLRFTSVFETQTKYFSGGLGFRKRCLRLKLGIFFLSFELQMGCLRLKPCIVFGCLRLKHWVFEAPGII